METPGSGLVLGLGRITLRVRDRGGLAFRRRVVRLCGEEGCPRRPADTAVPSVRGLRPPLWAFTRVGNEEAGMSETTSLGDDIAHTQTSASYHVCPVFDFDLNLT